MPTATITDPGITTQTASASPHSYSLSAGTDAGIGVSIAIFLALTGFLAYWFIVRHRASTIPVVLERSSVHELHGGGPYRDAEAELEEPRVILEADAGNKDWFPIPGNQIKDKSS